MSIERKSTIWCICCDTSMASRAKISSLAAQVQVHGQFITRTVKESWICASRVMDRLSMRRMWREQSLVRRLSCQNLPTLRRVALCSATFFSARVSAVKLSKWTQKFDKERKTSYRRCVQPWLDTMAMSRTKRSAWAAVSCWNLASRSNTWWMTFRKLHCEAKRSSTIG